MKHQYCGIVNANGLKKTACYDTYSEAYEAAKKLAPEGEIISDVYQKGEIIWKEMRVQLESDWE